MPNKCQIQLNKEWVCQHLTDVTGIETKKAAWVLVQEPGFIGFGVVEVNEIWLPPYEHKPSKWEPDWELISDLRLFGEKGEWHVWRDWDGKHYARLLEFQNINDNNALTECHALWGNGVKYGPSPWIILFEDRGAEIWLPLAESDLDKSNLPLRLKLKQIIDYDPDYHLAGITDAALVELVCESGNVLPPPTNLSSCS